MQAKRYRISWIRKKERSGQSPVSYHVSVLLVPVVGLPVVLVVLPAVVPPVASELVAVLPVSAVVLEVPFVPANVDSGACTV
jgi:hypothetical protein